MQCSRVDSASPVFRRSRRSFTAPPWGSSCSSRACTSVGFAGLFKPAVAVLVPAAMLAAGILPTTGFLRERFAEWKPEPDSHDSATRIVAFAAAALGLCGTVVVYLGSMTPEAINFDASWSHLADRRRLCARGAHHRVRRRLHPQLPPSREPRPHVGDDRPVVGGPRRDAAALDARAPPGVHLLPLDPRRRRRDGLLAGGDATPAGSLGVVLPRSRPSSFTTATSVGLPTTTWPSSPRRSSSPPCAPPRASNRGPAPSSAPTPRGALLTKYQAVYAIAGVGLVFAVFWGAGDRWLPIRATSGSAATADRRHLAWGAGGARRLVRPGGRAALHEELGLLREPDVPVHAGLPAEPADDAARGLSVRAPLQGLRAGNRKARSSTRWSTRSAPLSPGRSSPHYSFTHDVPSGGALFTLCLPLPLAIRGPRALWLGFAAGLGALFAWAMIFRVDRHLQTFMPLLAATTAAVLARAWELGGRARAGLLVLVGLQVIWAGDAPLL